MGVLPQREPGVVGVPQPACQGDDRFASLQFLGGVEVAQGVEAVLPGRLPHSGPTPVVFFQLCDHARSGQGRLPDVGVEEVPVDRLPVASRHQEVVHPRPPVFGFHRRLRGSRVIPGQGDRYWREEFHVPLNGPSHALGQGHVSDLSALGKREA